MCISLLTQSQFDELNLRDGCRALWVRSQEVEWYSDSTGTVLGTVLFSQEAGHWGYVMCARVNGGDFKRLGVGSDFPSLSLAQNDLKASMERHVHTNDSR